MTTGKNTLVPHVVEQLRERIRGVEQPRRGRGEDACAQAGKPSVPGGWEQRQQGEGGLSTGWPPLDALLPAGGLRRGALVEWLAAGPGSGAAMLAWGTAQQAVQAGGAIVVLDRRRRVYPPALAAWGVDLERVIFVQPENAQDESWAWDQALRCPGVAAVWGWVERLDSRLFRRWQLAAEASGCVGLLLRPCGVRDQPTWAEVRWWVEPRPAAAGRRMRVELLRCRGAGGKRSVELVLDEWTGQLCGPARVGSDLEQELRHATHPRPLAAQLARATARPRAARADAVRDRAV